MLFDECFVVLTCVCECACVRVCVRVCVLVYEGVKLELKLKEMWVITPMVMLLLLP